jgi:deoxyadenosine/deoxycytidine kinase
LNIHRNPLYTIIILIKDCYYYQRKNRRCKEKGRDFTAEIKKIVERYLISVHSAYKALVNKLTKDPLLLKLEAQSILFALIRKGHFAMKRPV